LPAIRKQSCLIQIKTRVQDFLKLCAMLAIKTSRSAPAANPEVVQTLESVRLAKESVTSLRRQLEADQHRHRNLLSRSRELVAQSENLLAKASMRMMTQSAPYQLYDYLAQAERHVKEGQDVLSRQHKTIAELKRGGHDAADALQLLADFEEIQALHVADRDRLRKELGLA
jgi:hypothetical protein